MPLVRVVTTQKARKINREYNIGQREYRMTIAPMGVSHPQTLKAYGSVVFFCFFTMILFH